MPHKHTPQPTQPEFQFDETGPNPSGLCMCGCDGIAPIATEDNPTWGRVKGKPCRFISGHQLRRGTLPERFWEKVDVRDPDECWEWQAGKTVEGYGRIYTGKISLDMAHRVSYELHHGPIPEGMKVLHKCDNPPCCNPAHLFLGDDLVNVCDKIAKGRSNMPTGERHHGARFTNEQVREVRRLFATGNYTQRGLARMFGVNRISIRGIVRGESYQDA